MLSFWQETYLENFVKINKTQAQVICMYSVSKYLFNSFLSPHMFQQRLEILSHGSPLYDRYHL